MRQLVKLVILGLLLTGWAESFAGNPDIWRSTDVRKIDISGDDYLLLEKAVGEARKRQFDMNHYTISLFEDRSVVDGKKSEFLVVVFMDKSVATSGTIVGKGNLGVRPGLEVKFRIDTREMTGVSFVR